MDSNNEKLSEMAEPNVTSTAAETQADSGFKQTDKPVYTRGEQIRRSMAVYGFLLVLMGWLTMNWYGWISLGCTVAGLIVSFVSLRIPAGARRNLAITAIVAGMVLMLVYALFIGLLHFI